MKEAITDLLKPFADACYALVSAIPLDAAAAIYILVLVILAAWVLTLKGERLQKQDAAGTCMFLRDLRLWAVLIMLMQIVIYVILR